MCHQSEVDERVHTYSLTYGQSIMICFYMMGLCANFTMKEVASSTNSYANCHYDIYQGTFSTYETQFLQVIGFLGFVLIFFSLPDSGVSSQNLVFSCYGCQEEQEMGVHASPNTCCFSHQSPLLGTRKSAPKKIKNNFFPR